MKYAILAAGVLLLAGALAWWAREEIPKVMYERVIVEKEVITELEPDTVVQWREKIVYRTVPPTTVADAPDGAVDDVAAFCAQMIHESVVDTTRPEFTGPARLLIRSGRKDGSRLVLTGPVSDGTLRQSTFDGIRGDYQWRVTQDSILMQSDRWWWTRSVLYGAALLGAGYFAGNLTN